MSEQYATLENVQNSKQWLSYKLAKHSTLPPNYKNFYFYLEPDIVGEESKLRGLVRPDGKKMVRSWPAAAFPNSKQ